ncbi:HAMP domain-containing histidine kinase [Sulfurimonas sp. SAG-AH-194-I05]|nr:HAMP domain-containing sensor histidine kinase [Sulfurimonas sp. SAG-AH-194-I05]MDF1874305.1 HAMP domain-containing histidine kinase [Sulfurimonas sp. SAG-AH-194-I05]
MSVSKSLDTDLLRSEKQTLFRFSSLYILFSIVIVFAFSFMYYDAQKDLMLQEKRHELQEHSKNLIEDLKQLHINFDKNKYYPRSDAYESAILDSDENLIFQTIKTRVKLNEILYLGDGMIHLVSIPESYYVGAKFVIVMIKDDELWLEHVKKELLLFNSIALSVMLIVGYILLQLFIKPMRDAMHLLDRFIKDTTHELNTPVSTIVTNIEMINKENLDEKTLKKINRIDIGAKTISNIYQDLTYLTLGNKIISNDETLDIAHVVEERIEYFKSLASARKVTLHSTIIQNTSLYMDKGKFSKLLDNLISNAIKYNKMQGSVTVHVDTRRIVVEDSGIGIAKKNIAKLQDRYARFNKSSGGFGIGLNIVSSIAKEYSLNIKITSEEKIGTKVHVSW